MPEWFQINMQADNPAVAEIFINDYIGNWSDQMWNEWADTDSPITAKAFIDTLAALPGSVKLIRVHINSPGGDVAAAVMMANALRDQRVTKGRSVETIVDGLAASSASLVAMAGSPVRMADNGILMIHDPWAGAVGNATELRKTADVLDRYRDASIIPTYQWHTKLSADEIAALMVAETWMDAVEAVERGFVDEVVVGLKAAASIDPRVGAKLKVPDRFADRVQALFKPSHVPAAAPAPSAEPKPVPADQIIAACVEASLDITFARDLMSEGVTVEDLGVRISREREVRSAAESRANNIRDLCGEAHADLVPELIASGWTFDQVKAHICKVAAKLDKVEIDAGLAPATGAAKKPAIDISAIYAELNKSQSH